MMRCQFLSPRVCITASSVRKIITSASMKNGAATVHGNDNQFLGTERYQNGNTVHEIGSTPHHAYINTSKFQRIILGIGSSIAALINPHRLTSFCQIYYYYLCVCVCFFLCLFVFFSFFQLNF